MKVEEHACWRAQKESLILEGSHHAVENHGSRRIRLPQIRIFAQQGCQQYQAEVVVVSSRGGDALLLKKKRKLNH